MLSIKFIFFPLWQPASQNVRTMQVDGRSPYCSTCHINKTAKPDSHSWCFFTYKREISLALPFSFVIISSTLHSSLLRCCHSKVYIYLQWIFTSLSALPIGPILSSHRDRATWNIWPHLGTLPSLRLTNITCYSLRSKQPLVRMCLHSMWLTFFNFVQMFTSWWDDLELPIQNCNPFLNPWSPSCHSLP